MVRKMMHAGKGESLGKKEHGRRNRRGMRNVETIEQGAIGNDRPIQIVNEHWFSEELGMTVYSKRSDPRTGEETSESPTSAAEIRRPTCSRRPRRR
jgi:hypothetical protein